MDINAKVKLLAETMSGYTVIVDTPNGANVELDKTAMPCILIFIQESGEFLSANSHYRDSVNIRVAVLNKMTKGFKESDVEAMRYILKQDMILLYHKLKYDFQFKINTELIKYEIVYDEFDANLIGVVFNDNIKERTGINLACETQDSIGTVPIALTFCEKVSECGSIISINGMIENLQEQIDNLPTEGMTCNDLATCETITDIQDSVDEVVEDLSTHISDDTNPHQTTLEQARTADNFFTGEVDMNGNPLRNLPVPTNADEATNKAYVDGLVDNTLKAAESYNPNITNLFPVTYGGNAIKKGDTFRLQSGTMSGVIVDNEDLLIANIDDPAQTVGNWQILESNREQATESTKGIAKIVTQIVIEDEFTSNNTDIVTAQKFWFGILRFLSQAWTFAAKITFTLAPRFNSVTDSQYLKVDANKDLISVAAIPATDITEDITHRFVTDTDKTTWNSTTRNIIKSTVNGSVTVTGTTNQTITESYLIPANTVLVGSILDLALRIKFVGASGSKTSRVYFNTSASLTGATIVGTYLAGAGALNVDMSRHLAVKSTTSTEVFGAGVSTILDDSQGGGVTSANINWTVDQYLIVVIQLTIGTDSGVISFIKLQD